jgi:hypothetical protein
MSAPFQVVVRGLVGVHVTTAGAAP